MSRIFTPIISVFALQFALCLAGWPRAITVRFYEFDSEAIVKASQEFDKTIAATLSSLVAGTPEPLDKITEFEKRENAIQREAKALADALQDNKDDPFITGMLKQRTEELHRQKAELEKIKVEIAENMIKAGHIVFVPGPPSCILVPPALETVFLKFQKLGVLISYVFANIRSGIDSDKPIEDASKKKITSIGTSPFKIHYMDLKFLLPYNNLVHTLGAVRKGLTQKKIQEHDATIKPPKHIAPKKISELVALYDGKKLALAFDPELHIDSNEPGLRTVTGIIKGPSLTIFTEFTREDRKITTSKVLTVAEIKILGGNTLDTVTKMKQKEVAELNTLAPEDVHVKFTLTFSYNN